MLIQKLLTNRCIHHILSLWSTFIFDFYNKFVSRYDIYWRQLKWIKTVHRQDSLQTHIWRQFTDKSVHRHTFEDSSPTELKTVHRQNWRQFTDKFYIVFIMNVTCFTIIWDTIKHMTNIKLLELNDFCGTSIFLLDIYMPNAYREIITLSVYTGLVLVEKKTTIV